MGRVFSAREMPLIGALRCFYLRKMVIRCRVKSLRTCPVAIQPNSIRVGIINSIRYFIEVHYKRSSHTFELGALDKVSNILVYHGFHDSELQAWIKQLQKRLNGMEG